MSHRWKLLSVSLLAALVSTSFTTSEAAAAPTIYYVDQTLGSDSANGTSQQTPWKSLAKVSSTELKPGETVLLRRGGNWSGGLAVRGSGSASALITIGAYGTGARPIVKSHTEACVDLPGNYIRVQDLQIGVAADAGRCCRVARRSTSARRSTPTSTSTGMRSTRVPTSTTARTP
jgi:hypothetical protein